MKVEMNKNSTFLMWKMTELFIAIIREFLFINSENYYM